MWFCCPQYQFELVVSVFPLLAHPPHRVLLPSYLSLVYKYPHFALSKGSTFSTLFLCAFISHLTSRIMIPVIYTHLGFLTLLTPKNPQPNPEKPLPWVWVWVWVLVRLGLGWAWITPGISLLIPNEKFIDAMWCISMWCGLPKLDQIVSPQVN